MAPDEQVRVWMTPGPATVSPETPVMDAHQTMIERKIRRLPVMEGDRLVGIVTLGDLRGAGPSEATSLSIWEIHYLISRLTVGRIMSRPVITIPVTSRVEDAARLMLEHRIAGLPVMDGRQLVGIITESDIFRMLVRSWRPEGTPVAV